MKMVKLSDFYLLSVMAYFYVVIIIHCHRIGYKRE